MKSAALLTTFFLFSSYTVFAQSGVLDLGFDVDGIQTTDIGSLNDNGNDLALQADGKIVVVGMASNINESDFAVLRYLPNGSLDSSFHFDGIVTLDFDTAIDQPDQALTVVIQPDGKIVVAGCATIQGNYDLGIARFNTDGSLDNSFDGDGVRTIHFGITGGHNEVFDAKIDGNGKITMAGYTQTASSGKNFALFRLNSDGSTDSSFGNAGLVNTDFSGLEDIAYSLVILNDGRIAAAGSSVAITTTDYALAMYSSSGQPDNSFSADGKLTTDFGASFDVAYDLVQQGDGKLVAAGYSYVFADKDFSIARYSLTGQLDPNFDTDGKNTVDINGSSNDDEAHALTIQPDNKILVGGFALNGTSQNLGMARYDFDGSLDGSFGAGGKVITDILTSPNDVISAMAVQSTDLKLIVAGTAGVASRDIVLARYTTGLNIGITEFTFSDHVLIYPNPIEEMALLQYTLLNTENITIQLKNMEGKIVSTIVNEQTQSPGVYEQKIQLPNHLSSGIYFIVVASAHGSVAVKILH